LKRRDDFRDLIGYAGRMRYPDGGGLTAKGRARREQVRLEAAEMFARGVPRPEVARRLRVSRNAAYTWYHRWQAGGVAALASKGSGGSPCRLSAEQLAQLSTVLDAGPAASGWVEDQRWTLARVARVIKKRFGVSYSLKGTSLLLHRIGLSVQVPVHRAAERDEQKIAQWRQATWPGVKKPPATWARGSSSQTNPVSRFGRPRPAPGPVEAAPR
jgi:putative transposase